ncbi:SUMF1/EgtB/PvdO family nonheme iron enzyme [bacterium]|nr:SUMF1/EgtB/PvdO family nonheme iron enzyme [bacterium]
MTPTPEAPAGPDPRQAMIQALVLEAQSFLISKQYVRPARPDNVLDKLKKIEEIEPKHPFLAAARGQILDDYEGQIDKAIARKDWLAARNLVNDARLVAPDHPRVGNLDARVEDAGKSAAAPAVAATGECPADMAFISGGTFSMGIRPNDPMAQPNDPAPSEAAFKSFCVDFFEYPNKEGALPEGGFDFAMAQNACKDAGKRLCTETEWEAACASGTRDRKFPYGNVYIEDACATQTSEGRDRGVAYSGSWHGCKTVQNVFDLSGNLREWTATPFDDDKTAYVIKGGDGYNPGHAARCGARQSAAGSAKRSWLGFRCCKDPS